MNSHIPSFFEPIAYGATPPAQREPTAVAASVCPSGMRHPVERSRKSITQSPPMKCQ